MPPLFLVWVGGRACAYLAPTSSCAVDVHLESGVTYKAVSCNSTRTEKPGYSSSNSWMRARNICSVCSGVRKMKGQLDGLVPPALDGTSQE
ncbi:unnamed protein product [Pleuronectes platessa]|uniref:Uncharacterized protein n=1 Tax=Pleuronectes platessa TaxID=8262 RepID=A0A9N7U282_PLEPL|nr:unnamed protein product [Pleuronectes platessa]